MEPTPAQDQALTRLVAAGTLNEDQASAVRAALFEPGAAPVRRPAGTVLTEVAGYAGGGLMLGGTALLLSLTWDKMTRETRVGLLAGIAVLFILAALIVAGGPAKAWRLRDGHHQVRQRLVGVLLALASIPAAISAGESVEQHGGLVGGGTGLVVAVAGYALTPIAPGVLAAALMSMIAMYGLLEATNTGAHLRTMYAFVGLGLLWYFATNLRLVRPRQLGLGIGAGLVLYGAQSGMFTSDSHTLGYGLTFVAGLGCFVAYWWERATVLLVGGVIGVTLAVPEAISDWTRNSLGGPVVLLVAGAVLIAASAVGLRLRSARQSD